MELRPKEYSFIDFNSVEASEMAQRSLRKKKCLNDIYREIYSMIMSAREKYLATGGEVLEIGSGGDFVKTLFPQVTTSDIKQLANVDLIFSAENLPFKDNSLDAIISVFVLHHIPNVIKFFEEAYRCLKPGGGIICVETYYGPLARFVYKNMHPEPFDENASDWLVRGDNPMTSSNQALSYLILQRDKERFKKRFPGFHLVYQKPFGFLRYMLTGGMWLKQKAPDWMFPFLKAVEALLTPLMPYIGLHHIFVIKKYG
jgi:SAM-dependent methyltransferase